MRNRRGGRVGLTLVYIVLGAIVGGMVGRFLQNWWPPLGRDWVMLGSTQAPWSLNLGVFGVTVGGWLKLNLGGMVGMLVGLVAARRHG